MTQPTPTAAPPALLNITLGVMLALMLGWFFHIASGVLVPMVLGLMISYVVMAVARPKEARAPEPPSIIDAKETEKDDGLDPLDGLHPKITAWIAEHKREQKGRAQENRRRRNDIWSWGKSLLDDLTPRDLYRFRASSSLCRAIEAAGGRVKEADIHGKLTFTVGGRDIECMVKEKMSRPIKRPEGEAAKWTAYPHHHNSGLTS